MMFDVDDRHAPLFEELKEILEREDPFTGKITINVSQGTSGDLEVTERRRPGKPKRVRLREVGSG